MDREWRQAQISFEITMRMRRRIVRYLATKLVSVKITDMDRSAARRDLSRGGDDRDEVVEVTLKVGCFSVSVSLRLNKKWVGYLWKDGIGERRRRRDRESCSDHCGAVSPIFLGTCQPH
jgi:hypothetical protein